MSRRTRDASLLSAIGDLLPHMPFQVGPLLAGGFYVALRWLIPPSFDHPKRPPPGGRAMVAREFIPWNRLSLCPLRRPEDGRRHLSRRATQKRTYRVGVAPVRELYGVMTSDSPGKVRAPADRLCPVLLSPVASLLSTALGRQTRPPPTHRPMHCSRAPLVSLKPGTGNLMPTRSVHPVRRTPHAPPTHRPMHCSRAPLVSLKPGTGSLKPARFTLPRRRGARSETLRRDGERKSGGAPRPRGPSASRSPVTCRLSTALGRQQRTPPMPRLRRRHGDQGRPKRPDSRSLLGLFTVPRLQGLKKHREFSAPCTAELPISYYLSPLA
jgi:hypothetical protein